MNKLILISDIHANIHALKAVRACIEKEYPGAPVSCLGDMVGYGGNPEEVISMIRDWLDPDLIIGGNHDYGLLEHPGFNVEHFNSAAREAVDLHRELLTHNSKHWLERLPMFMESPGILFCHGSPISTNHYITTRKDIGRSMNHVRTFGRRLICYGHTHVPALYLAEEGSIRSVPVKRKKDAATELSWKDGEKAFINPGSVGQPRDGNPQASFAMVELKQKTVTFHSVKYDISGAAMAILEKKMPSFLAERLSKGI